MLNAIFNEAGDVLSGKKEFVQSHYPWPLLSIVSESFLAA